jgi:hypothetical protein
LKYGVNLHSARIASNFERNIAMLGPFKVFYVIITICLVQMAHAATFSFDENGHGGVIPEGPPILSTMAPDPTAGGAQSVLTYILRFPILPGDVLLLNPADMSASGEGNSDLIRFIPSDPFIGGSPAMLFYSDLDDSGETSNLADIGLPPFGAVTTVAETGPEGNNGADYTPGPTDPGYSSVVSGGATYHIISDMPEPASFVLLVIGGLCAFGYRSKWRNRVLGIGNQMPKIH